MSLEDTDILELQDRYFYLIPLYVQLAMELAPKIEKFGKYRKELQLLTAEFVRRGVSTSDPEGLTKLVEEELTKRKQIDGEQKNDSSTGHSGPVKDSV